MRRRTMAAIALAAAMVFGGATGPALASDPVDLGSTFVYDEADVLSASQESDVEARLERLSAETDVDLWVVFVDEFTGAASAEDWANTTADGNGLGPHQYLLAVAVEARQFYLSGYSEGPVSFDRIAEIERAEVQPYLAAEDWAGAAVAAADGLQSSVGGTSGSSASGGLPWGGILVAILVVGAIALVVWLVIRRRRRGAAAGAAGAPGASPVDLPELEKRAASALVATDDAIRTSEQELGFATAQFGEAAAAEFTGVLADAKAKLTRAFTLQQQLDDSTPDSHEQAVAWNAEILELCESANDALDAKAAAFAELRRLAQNAPEALARVEAARAQVADALEAAASDLAQLETRYAPEALATVADNPSQAQARIAFADEQLALARQAIDADDGSEAAVAIRAAEEAVGQADLLEKAIGTLATHLDDGGRNALALIAELENDIAAASALPDADGRLAAVIASTRGQIDAARGRLGDTGRRPLAALESLEAANQQIDGLVSEARDAAARAERARQMVGQQIMQAQAQVSTAEDYITARRGAVGAAARTRLAEAGAALVHAQQLQQTAPEQAAQHAQRANQLAAQAIQSAQRDVGGFSGVSGRTSGDNGMMGAVLGGIVINSLLGGGGSGRRSRSSGFGGFGGGGFSGGSRSRPSSGGFGGGSRSRSGGGRF